MENNDCFAYKIKNEVPACNALAKLQTGCGAEKCAFYKSREGYLMQCAALSVEPTKYGVEKYNDNA